MTPLDDLREINCGDHTGEKWDTFFTGRDVRRYRFRGGESFPDFSRRVAAVTDQIVSDNPGATVVITAHGWLNKIFLMNAFGIGLGSFWQMPLLPCTALDAIAFDQEFSHNELWLFHHAIAPEATTS